MKRIFGHLIFFLIIISSIRIIGQEKEYQEYKNDVFWSNDNRFAHVLLNRAQSAQSHITWGTGHHTASPVPVGAIGPEKYTNQLKGVVSNDLIGRVTREAVNDGVNVILMVGDGMGINHMSLPIYMRIAEGDTNKTYFEKIMKEGSCGISFTNPANGIVTGSAASGTALATGHKTFINMISVDTNGYPLESTLELAQKLNFGTGLVTDAGITDATPAVFYAHKYNRNLENDIAEQLANQHVDVVFGGGAAKFIPKGTQLKDYKYYKDSPFINQSWSNRDDNKNLFAKFEAKGYSIISNKDDLAKLSDDTKKVIGLFAGGGISPAINRDTEQTGEPSLVDLSKKAVDLLSKNHDKFFIMIEAGRIDWEAHDNDAGSVYKAVAEMNQMLKVCYDFQKKNTNTLLVFTADHETGGLGIAYTDAKEEYKKQLPSGDEWTSGTDPLSFQQFEKLKDQKKAVYKVFGEAKSAEELYKYVNDNSSYKITMEDAEMIFNKLHGYKKSK